MTQRPLPGISRISRKETLAGYGVSCAGRPTLIAFIDHLCYTCLRSVGPLDQLRREFSGRANVIVLDPSRITTAHTCAKDHCRVWIVSKFAVLDKRGVVAKEYFGPTPLRILASDLQPRLAQ